MKKKIIGFCAILILCCFDCSRVAAAYKPEVKFKEIEAYAYFYPQVIRCTLYCEHHKTASGSMPHFGIAAGRKEWLGQVACINAVNEDGSVGELIGLFEFKDTGAGFDTDHDGIGDSIKNGTSIDVWVESPKEIRAWQKNYGDYVYIKLIKGVG